MPASGFHSEWFTVNDHRILLECRDGFPGETEKFIAAVSVEVIAHNGSNSARVVSIYYNDKSCCHNITIASTNKDDAKIKDTLTTVLENIYGNSNCLVSVEIVSIGNEHSDHYNHMEHLSVETNTAVDKWRHKDQEYQKDVHSPY